MKNIIKTSVIALMLVICSVDFFAQNYDLKTTNGNDFSAAKPGRVKIVPGPWDRRDSIPRNFPDSLAQPTIIPIEYSPGNQDGEVQTYCNLDNTPSPCGAANKQCVVHKRDVSHYCINQMGQEVLVKIVHQFNLNCYRTVLNPNGIVCCEVTTWSYERVELFGPACIANYKKEDDEDINLESNITSIKNIWPNPVSDQATFNINLATSANLVSIKIVDVRGRIVDELNQQGLFDGNVTISTSFDHLNNGLYSALLFVDGQYTSSSKLILAH